MRALEQPLVLTRTPLLAGTPWTAVLVLAAAWLLAVATLLPISPLLLTMMPLEELLKKLAGMLL